MADEQTDRIGPVSLPVGSFELSELDKALSAAVSVKDREQHPERINKAIAQTIHMPELLVEKPAVPMGASIIEETVEIDGEKVKTERVAFDAVDAETGEDAAKMKYAERRTGGDVEAVVVEEVPVVSAPAGAAEGSLAAAAEDAIAEEQPKDKGK